MRMKLIPYRVAAMAVVALLASQPAAKAQVMVEEEEVVEWVPGKAHYYAESALDNWYISAGAGTQTFLPNMRATPSLRWL